MARPIHVAILGASGYGAGELLRLLTQHAAAEVVSVTSTSRVREPVSRVHPHLRGFYDLTISETVNLPRLLDAEQAVVFSTLPHGASGAAIDGLLRQIERGGGANEAGARVKVIDLSADFRLRDERLHAVHYPESAAMPERRRAFVYGLPELYREEIRRARFVANPGCLATAAILAAAPLARDGRFSGPLVIDAKTGSSGSGSSLKETTHHPTRHADFRAYKPLAHQHEPEILQALNDPHGQRVRLSFVPQSMDAARGIYVTAHLALDAHRSERDAQSAPPPGEGRGGGLTETGTEALRERYLSFYADCPFIRVLDEPPTLQDVVGSNFCDISVAARPRPSGGAQVIVMAALDNLVKGMAGTAIQNMNLMCGLEETTGLWSPSFRPL